MFWVSRIQKKGDRIKMSSHPLIHILRSFNWKLGEFGEFPRQEKKDLGAPL
jgi:hypothetical protein